MRPPDFAMISTRLHATPESTGGTFSSMSAGSQFEGKRVEVASIGTGGEFDAVLDSRSVADSKGACKSASCFTAAASEAFSRR